MRNVLVAIDGSDSAARALHTAAVLAAGCGAMVTIMTVVPRPTDEVVREMRRVEHVSVDELATAAGRGILAAAGVEVRRLGVVEIEDEVAIGEPVGLILAAAERTGADMIVVGKRGVSQLSGLFVGSVSQGLVSQAPCPVLVVP